MRPPSIPTKYTAYAYISGDTFEEMKKAVSDAKDDNWFPKGPVVCGFDPLPAAHPDEPPRVKPKWVQSVTRVTYKDED